MIENSFNLFIGVILMLLSIFILVKGVFAGESEVVPVIFIVLIISLIIKLFIVFIVSVLLLFKDRIEIFKYADSIGSVLINVIVFKVAFDIIKVNVNYLLVISEEIKKLA